MATTSEYTVRSSAVGTSLENERILAILKLQKSEAKSGDTFTSLDHASELESFLNHKANFGTAAGSAANFERLVADISRQLERYKAVEKAIASGSLKTIKQTDLDECSYIPQDLLPNGTSSGAAAGQASHRNAGVLVSRSSLDKASSDLDEHALEFQQKALRALSELNKLDSLVTSKSLDGSMLGRKSNRVIAAELAKRIELLKNNHGEYEMFYAQVAKYKEQVEKEHHKSEILRKNKISATKNTPQQKAAHQRQRAKESCEQIKRVQQRHALILEQKRKKTIEELLRKCPQGGEDYIFRLTGAAKLTLADSTEGKSQMLDSQNTLE